MSVKLPKLRFQFRLLHFLIGISLLLMTFYAVWRWNAPKPAQLSRFGHGGLHRWTDTFQYLLSEQSFEGGVLVLKNEGLINSTTVSFPAKGSFSLGWTMPGVTTLYCSSCPKGIVILDLNLELKQATSVKWGDTDRSPKFHEHENEWLYEERSLVINGVIHTYKIIIYQNEKIALSKYSKYSPNTHPGKPSIKPVVNSE